MSFREYLEGSTTWYVDGKNIGQTVNGHGYLMECIKEFLKIEFGVDEYATDRPAIEPDFTDLEHVPLVYTQSDDGEHDFQWEVNIPAKTLILLIDGGEEMAQDFECFLDLGNYIKDLEQGELIADADAYYEGIYSKRGE